MNPVQDFIADESSSEKGRLVIVAIIVAIAVYLVSQRQTPPPAIPRAPSPIDCPDGKCPVPMPPKPAPPRR